MRVHSEEAGGQKDAEQSEDMRSAEDEEMQTPLTEELKFDRSNSELSPTTSEPSERVD